MKKCPHCGELIGDSVVEKCPLCFGKLDGSSSATKNKSVVTRTYNPSTSSTSPTPSTASPTINNKKIIVTTTDSIEGYTIVEYMECVSGTDIYLVGGLLGGGLGNQENLYGEAFRLAKDRMAGKALLLDADAIVGVKFETVSPGGLNHIIVIATGTAVRIKKVN